MQRKIIPTLITLMAISLVGIIFIQYRWIQNTISEKQKLIDSQVYSGIAKVEEQLNNIRDINLIKESFRSRPHHFPALSAHPEHQEIGGGVTVYMHKDSNEFVELKVLSESQSGVNHFREIDHIFITEDGTGEETVEDCLTFVMQEGYVDQALRILDKVNAEGIMEQKDIRLDSLKIQTLLNTELKGIRHAAVLSWGVYDGDKNQYLISPTGGQNMNYKVRLFSTDILHPRRYELQLNLNANDIIWKEIKGMTLLSILFLLIIISVFAFSIRLIIKHKKISQIKSDFINNMTHEFKTPLASISLAADSLIHPNAELSDNYLKQYVDIIQQEKRKLNAHVERILEVAALNRDALEIKLESVELVDTIQKAIKNLNLLIEKNQAKVHFDMESELLVKANAVHLENIFVNLIENGIKYGGDQPEININVTENNGVATVKIIDNGIGMTTRQLNKVFDHFYRAQTGDLHNSKGFGLGLSYCKLVIEKMGGSIRLNSKVNQGTTAEIKVNTWT